MLRSSCIEIDLLGSFEAYASGGAAIACAPRQRALLAYLALHANESVNAERILNDLWGQAPPASGLGTLRFHISKLRAAMGEQDAAALETTASGYRLAIDGHDLDVARFVRLARKASSAPDDDPRETRRRCRRAIAIWRGDALEEFRFDEFAQESIRYLEELRLVTVETRLEAELAMGMHRDVIPELEGLAREYPTRENLHESLMMALYRSGRTSEALHVYSGLAAALGEQGLEPASRLRDIEDQILLGDPKLLALPPLTTSRGSLLPAPMTRIIGRRDYIRAVEGALDAHRLVTLVGPGGVGKTRLALEAAHRLVAEGEVVAFWVDLALADSSTALASVCSTILGDDDADGFDRCERALRSLDSVGPAVVVLDNCERVRADVTTIVDRLLGEAPRASVLATSRVPLDMSVEAIVRIGPLEAPSLVRTEDLKDNAAIQLFSERALVMEELDTNDEAWFQEAARICQAVDGLPLAIEIAAARTRTMAIADVRSSLEERGVQLLERTAGSTSRHRSVSDAIEWSYDSMNESARSVFRALAVFRGAFRADSAVCVSGAVDVLDVLGDLVDASLVVAEGALVTRYRLLEPIRQYAELALRAADEFEAASRAHAEHFADQAERYRLVLKERGWSENIAADADLPNLRRSIEWFVAGGEWISAAHMIDAMADSWMTGRHHSEARYWFGRFCREADADPTAETARLLDDATYLAVLRGELAEAQSSQHRLEQLTDAIDDPVVAARGALRSASVLWFEGHRREALARIEYALPILRDHDADEAIKACLSLGKGYVTVGRLDDAIRVAGSLPAWIPSNRGVASAFANEIMSRVRYYQGRLKDAEEMAALAVRRLLEANLEHNAASAMVAHARALTELNRLDEAGVIIHRAMTIDRDLGDLLNASRCLREMARLERERGDNRVAADHLVEILDTIDLADFPLEFARFSLTVSGVLGNLGRLEDAARTMSWALGRLDELGVAVPVPIAEHIEGLRTRGRSEAGDVWSTWETDGLTTVADAESTIVDRLMLAVI